MPDAETAPPLSWARGDPAQRKAWRRYWIDDVVHGMLSILLYYGVKPLPIALRSAIGGWAGRTLGPWRGPAWDRRARANFARLRPDLDVDVATRAMWSNIGRSMIEFSALATLRSGKRSRIFGAEHLVAAKEAKRPRVMLMPHIGNWELTGPVVFLLGDEGMHFYQPPRNRFERFISRRARRSVADKLLLPTPADTRRGFRLLSGGEATLVIAIDEFIRGRVQGPFLGRPHRLDGNIGFAARMAVKADALLIPVYTVRVDGSRFEIHIEPPFEPSTGGTADENIAATADAINAAVEPIILEHLDQWLMLHDLRFDQD